MMNIKQLLTGLLLAGCCLSYAAEVSGFTGVEIDDGFLPFLAAKKRLMKTPGVKEFSLPGNRGRIIICIVSVASKGDSADAIAKMMKVCRIKAQVELIKVQEVEISAFTRVEEKIVSVDDGVRKKVESLSSYLDIAEERVHGVVKAMPVIGTWFSHDKRVFYLAVGKKLQGTAPAP